MRDIGDILSLAPVVPVLVIERVADAVPIAEALVDGGLPVLEVTLRTPAALDSIRAMATVPGAVVGAGTVLNRSQFAQAVDAGAQFAVSPGLTAALAEVAGAGPIPLLPGVGTASEVMHALDHGFTTVKYFPAEALGGIPALNALASVFGSVRFCPTGGIRPDTAADWLAIPSVLCVGGSWLVPAGSAIDRQAIVVRARQAASLRS